jgi:hypothetical protein
MRHNLTQIESFFLLKKKTRKPPSHPILFYFIFPLEKGGGNQVIHKLRFFLGPGAGGQISVQNDVGH